jgi:hypothetical protein
MEKVFPNGFESWAETHYEMVQAITIEWMKDSPSGIVADRQDIEGHGGLYELAQEWTDEFENKYKDVDWDGEFYDTIQSFIESKNPPDNSIPTLVELLNKG